MSIKHWLNQPLHEHTRLWDEARAANYRFLSLSLHGTISEPRYTAILIKDSENIEQRNPQLLTAREFQKFFDDQASHGFGPVIISATGDAGNPRFTAVFEKSNPIPLTRHILKHGDDDDLDTIEGMNKKAMLDGMILRWVASYGDADDPRFAAIWVPNTAKTIWNADGLKESVSQLQDRFGAQNSRWSRPALYTLNKDNRYLSLFVDNRVGRWDARHDLTGAEYKQLFDTLTDEEHGFHPICVQGAGRDDDTRYAAIFVKGNGKTEKRKFHRKGPVPNAKIDNLFRDIMHDTPSRHMSVAIVHRSKLVFACGYTLAESGYPVCEPTTHFRIASISKVVMALAIYQLIEKGHLDFSDKLQDILHLKTPAGRSPSQIFDIVSIRNLLEHDSGLDTDSYMYESSIRDAWNNQGPNPPYHLPMSADQTDAYVAGLNFEYLPGILQKYNNCGYYLLGRVLARKRNRDTPIDALREFLFNPLGITRIRRARSLLKDQPADEARYQIHEAGSGEEKRLTIGIGASVMSDARPIVPTGYGDFHYEKDEGAGGLSAAATDLARFIAILMSPHNNPALKHETIQTMLNNAVACQTKWNTLIPGGARAGHGFDAVYRNSDGSYYVRKGGLLPTNGTTFQFDGDWGFVCHLSGGMAKTKDGQGIYPDFPALTDIAKNVNWGDTDLFPHYGMAALDAKAAHG